VLAIARLAQNATARDLQLALDDVSRTSSPPARAIATAMTTAIARDAPRTLWLLGGAAMLALLIAFTNLAGLLLVRSIDRGRELAVRSALGAPGSEIARQLLLEAQGLVIIGILGGVLLALWTTPAVGRFAVDQFGSVTNRDVNVSWQLIAGMSIVASTCAWICGLVPAVPAIKRTAVDVLRRGATARPRDLALRRVLVTGEVALAFVLLVCVTLLGRSLLGLLETNPGFDARGVLTLRVALPVASYPNIKQQVSFYAALHDALAARLGGGAISIVDEVPVTGDRGRSLVSVRPTDVGREAVVRVAAPAYFDVMRIPVVGGRTFDRIDNESAPLRVVVSKSLAESVFALEQPIGRQVWLAATAKTAEIIGVVGDVRHRALDAPLFPTVYLSAWQIPSPGSHIVVRSALPEADVTATVRDEVARLDSALPVYGIRSMEEFVAASPGVPGRRVLTTTFLAFALLALVLSGIGLFGVVAHDVASRRAELGLRIALGADPMRILRATVGQGVWMIGSGLAVGGLLSIWAVRALATVLVTSNQFDIVIVVVPAAVLMGAGATAIFPLARRAARTDPLTALRNE
jgi:putative ABC transport system permease protein